MPTASLLAPATAAATSAEWTQTFAAPSTLSLRVDPAIPNPGACADIQIESSGGSWITVGAVSIDRPSFVLQASGDYRISKGVTSTAVGVDRSTDV